jgi:hypothetical protein
MDQKSNKFSYAKKEDGKKSNNGSIFKTQERT